MQEKIDALIGQMTLGEKASLCSGMSTWHTQSIERLDIPAIMVADGPHGLRKQLNNHDNLGLHGSIKAVCFPAACATACSFDRALLFEMGQALGEECQSEDIAVLLGPGANLKRSPLCGRNFEYFSEDPYLSSHMTAAFIQGVQSKGVGCSLKHFAANNQETRRMSVSADMDERTLRELYLASFEYAVKEAKPQTIMCSYNRINGTYVSENPFILNQVLRDEWGYEGLVVSDWGAVNQRVPGLAAGMDLEMPDSGGVNDRKIVEAVQNAQLDEAILDKAIARVLRLVLTWQENRTGEPCDWDAHHSLAEKIETESIVLLKNENDLLPLKQGKTYAFIGAFADAPRYQGGGSSHINSNRVDSALQACAEYANITYAQGYDLSNDAADNALISEAVEIAKEADAAIIFAGLPDAFESEGFDREHMDLPTCQNALIAAITAAQKNVIVVLHNGSPVAMPWLSNVPALLEAYLGGQAVGAVVGKVLFGKANPSGKLAESFPLKLSDNPSYLNFPGDRDRVKYSEGLFIGYRYYDKKEMDVLFPFGHGLSYTSFEYSDLRLSAPEIDDTQSLEVTVSIKNTGGVFGKEIVQLYVSDHQKSVTRPIRELKGFEKVALDPGVSQEVKFVLSKRDFAYWNEQAGDWHVQGGLYTVSIGVSSRDLRLQGDITINATQKPLRNFHMNSTMGELLESPRAAAILLPQIEAVSKKLVTALGSMGDNSSGNMRKMMLNLPLRSWISLTKILYSQAMLNEVFCEG